MYESTGLVKKIVENFTKKANLAELSSSFVQLENHTSPSYGIYEAELGKRNRSGRKYEETQPTTSKKKKQQQESVLDVDEEIVRIANTPLSSLEPSSRAFQPGSSKFRFQQILWKLPHQHPKRSQQERLTLVEVLGGNRKA
ncbi:hypothetical protein VP01_571g9 [Puccinia sorghi]|uniref:Uncharacterized protein n=1 Tax=Puccinia sorghi TaxID=27349 RepID=A0A0L6UIP2_9BASI|nr:hypothetical protein VP01_571g9 [Puccinia sorghi]